MELCIVVDPDILNYWFCAGKIGHEIQIWKNVKLPYNFVDIRQLLLLLSVLLPIPSILNYRHFNFPFLSLSLFLYLPRYLSILHFFPFFLFFLFLSCSSYSFILFFLSVSSKSNFIIFFFIFLVICFIFPSYIFSLI